MSGRIWSSEVSDAGKDVMAALTPADNETVLAEYVYWSYSGTPTGGGLSIASDLDSLIELDITNGGPGFLPLGDFPIVLGEELLVTLNGGGGSVVGKVSVLGRTVR